MAESLISSLGKLFSGGERKYNWEPFIQDVEKRSEILFYSKIIIPMNYFSKVENSFELYTEAVYAHLVDLPNACIPVIFRCLEMGLKQKYFEEENKKSNFNSYDLIGWAEKFFGNRKELAHGFRILRNNIHETSLLTENDSLETIRHISIFLNLLYPFEIVKMGITCPKCGHEGEFSLDREECYMGYERNLHCTACKKTFSKLITLDGGRRRD